MKLATDPRHQKRENIVKLLYQQSFRHEPSKDKDLEKIWNKVEKIDKLISRAAPTWPVDKLNKIDLSILRLAVWELMIEKKVPPKVVIDEAVELAKKFGSESSPKFVNGALGALYQKEKK